jgi:glutamate synthase (ferredoxin)
MSQHWLQNSMYQSDFERDACGIGFVAFQHQRTADNVLPLALKALVNLVHRGGVAADGKTSDGAGVLCQLPYDFFARELAVRNVIPPAAGDLAVGMLFLPTRAETRARAQDLIKATLLGYRLKPLLWRRVPTDDRFLGETAAATRPEIYQILVSRPETSKTGVDFERALYVARRAIEKAAHEAGLADLYLCSLSSRTILYKGLLLGDTLGDFYLDLTQPTFRANVAVFHQRYSTNTFPTWHRAQPLRVMCHNGEINTIQGNVNWMRARESALYAECWENDMDVLRRPGIAMPGRSQSASRPGHDDPRGLSGTPGRREGSGLA